MLIACGLLLAGCGVQPTGLVDAGDPVGGIAPVSTLAYFFIDSRLRPVTVDPDPNGERTGPPPPAVRPGVDDPAVLAVGLALVALAAGPSPAQLAVGVSTEIPAGIAFELTSISVDAVLIAASPPGAQLTTGALAQIGCTVVSALSNNTETRFSGRVEVSLDPGSAPTEAPCPAAALEALPFSA